MILETGPGRRIDLLNGDEFYADVTDGCEQAVQPCLVHLAANDGDPFGLPVDQQTFQPAQPAVFQDAADADLVPCGSVSGCHMGLPMDAACFRGFAASVTGVLVSIWFSPSLQVNELS